MLFKGRVRCTLMCIHLLEYKNKIPLCKNYRGWKRLTVILATGVQTIYYTLKNNTRENTEDYKTHAQKYTHTLLRTQELSSVIFKVTYHHQLSYT